MGRIEKILVVLGTFCVISHCVNIVPVINMTTKEIREDTKIGEFAFHIDAYDLDGDPLTYGIIGQNAFYFDVDETTGDATVKSTLDHESCTGVDCTPGLIPLEVVVSDGFYERESAHVFIILIDANDNAPRFEGAPYDRAVREDTAVGTELFQVTATDPDFGKAGIVSLSIDQVIPADGAGLFSISEREGKVTLTRSLNFSLSASYQLMIRATDGGGPLDDEELFIQSSRQTVLITVIDVADRDPVFFNLPYSALVKEHSPSDTFVIQVQARDPDTGINDVISYSIQDTNAPDLFEINPTTGVITVKTEFDREALFSIMAVVSLTVKATESQPNVHGNIASTSANVSITIGDINDNMPTFYDCPADECTEASNFTGNIDENSSTKVAISGLNILVRDLDKEQNSRFNLHLEGPDKDTFSVRPEVGISSSFVEILVRDTNAIDYESRTTMTVQVVAVDADPSKEFSSTATVTIQINDVNDNVPKFEKEAYKLEVAEHSPDGTVMDTITATDPDTMDANNITYKLVPESMLKYFDVFPHNGTIYVKNGNLLDRERTNVYSPTLQARDSANNIGSTVLEITLLDINDQVPEVNRQTYDFFVKEGEDLGHVIEARDDDEPDTPNSKIQYRILDSDFSGNFTIDINTGELVNSVVLDREAIDPSLNGVIELNVSATDMGEPALSSFTKVVINVEDVNDNGPKFEENSYTFHVKERERGIFVGSVLAQDADQTEFNSRISFRIISGSLGSFISISEEDEDGYKGNIMVDPDVELDFESDHKTYNLIMEASDLGKHSATAKVEVVVVDVNDEVPEFPGGMSLRVKENTTLTEDVGLIEGKDPDTNHSLTYTLVSTECRCGGILEPCEEEWFTLESTGAVRANPKYMIDYEMCDQVLMTAKVTDLFTEIGLNSSEGLITINIEDTNDNAPEFISTQNLFVVVSENIEATSSVASVLAGDRDSAGNNKVTFSVSSVFFVKTDNSSDDQGIIFEAETTRLPDATGNYSGIIRSLGSLDADKSGKYLVTVQARDPWGLQTQTVLEIFTVDTTYRVVLQFESTVEEVKNNKDNIRAALTGATKATVQIGKITQQAAPERKRPITDLECYFVFPNGTALGSDSVWKILNQPDVYETYGSVLRNYGLTTILTVQEPKEDQTELFILVGLVGGLIIVLVVISTSLVCVKKSYQRKLKAAKAMNSAAMVTSDNQKTGPVVPGTNKYTMEGANPVLNLNIDTATDLGFDEDGSNTDRVSLNSLDYDIDMTMNERDTMPMMVIEEEDEVNGSESPYIEPLGAALAQRGRRRGADGPALTFSNPALSTTDL